MASPFPDHRIIVLGAARSLRRDLPPALLSVDRHGRVMDWLLAAFDVLPSSSVHFVSGYKASEIRDRYPQTDFIHNPDWETTGPAASLALTQLSSARSTYVTYSDVVFRPETVQRVAAQDADLVLAVDTAWRERFQGRARAELDQAEKVLLEGGQVRAVGKLVDTSEAGAEFVGLLKLSASLANQLQAALRSELFSPTAALPEIISYLLDQGVHAAVVDVRGDWAELNAPQDLSHFVLGTKAESLGRIKPLLKGGLVGDLVTFSSTGWLENRDAVLAEIREELGTTALIVRSSALSEDQWHQSSAGAYESVLNVDGSKVSVVARAVEEVLASYDESHPDDQVLVQKMVTDVVMSGVVMTRTPNFRAPYYVISFDDTSSSTESVTAGTSGSVRTIYLHRGEPLTSAGSEKLEPLLEVVREIEGLVGHDSLDIEFAVTGEGVVHVLQVRPIALPSVADSVDDGRVATAIEESRAFFRRMQTAAPFVVGKTTQLSIMSDWNPAEMIGAKPKRLAFSLYRFLITDEIWATQRAEYGYRDVRPCNLIVDVHGHPYIDVRATFNSFVPAGLPDELAGRLVDAALRSVTDSPELHDKVEFDVLFTCLFFGFDELVVERLGDVLDASERGQLREALREVTVDGMARVPGDFAQIAEIERRYERIMATDLDPLERAWVLLDDIRRDGTVLFSHLARAGFVAATLLRSLPATGCVAAGIDTDFIATLETVGREMQRDALAVAKGDSTFESLLSRYGHLRPGTYDITSPHYASAPELFLRPIVDDATEVPPPPPIPWDAATRKTISRELAKLDLDPDMDNFERFLKLAIEGRELCKFVFTRNLSAALESLASFGAEHGVSRDDLAHIRIQDFWTMRVARGDQVAHELRALARRGREAFALTEALCLPGQVFEPEQMGCYEQLKATPNYVTSKAVRARLVMLTATASVDTDVEGRIVVVPNADPGFDWLFSRRIAGLVTMYGGRNSHMTIRAAEFGLPAAVGVGELLFEVLAEAEVIELDCASHQIRVIR